MSCQHSGDLAAWMCTERKLNEKLIRLHHCKKNKQVFSLSFFTLGVRHKLNQLRHLTKEMIKLVKAGKVFAFMVVLILLRGT